MTIEQHAEAAAEEIDRSMTDGPVTIIAKHMQSAIDEATAQVRESWLRAARQDAELWDFIQQSHESICEAAGVECILDDAMVDLVPVAVGAINKLRARIAELEGLGPLIIKALTASTSYVEQLGIEARIDAILKGGA